MKKSVNKKYGYVHKRILTICFLFVLSLCRAQSCYDIDFETGTLNGWTTVGNVALVSTGIDYYGAFPVSAPGGNFSVKVGSISDNSTSTISKSFVVTAGNPILSYRYAMDILNYPHISFESGRVVIDILDNTNTEIPCAHYEAFYSTNGGLQDFSTSTRPDTSNVNGQCCFGISYKPWSNLSVDLTAFIGQTVTLKASSTWCIYGADWTYAYFDFGCTDYLIKQDTSCNAYGALLIAPLDFASYSWTGPGIAAGQTNDSVYVNLPGTYTVNMTTVTGCTISKNILTIRNLY